MCIIDPQYSQKKKGEITNNDEEENDKIDWSSEESITLTGEQISQVDFLSPI